MLGKAPGLTAIAVLTLALGIGANTAIFSVVYAALLRSLPYSQPSQLITLSERGAIYHRRIRLGLPPIRIMWIGRSSRRRSESLAGFSGDGFVFHGGGEPQVLFGAQVTTNFFSTLGVKPMLGRDFVAGEDIASGPKVAILTYSFWRTHFSGDPRVVGRAMHSTRTA